MDQNHSDKDRNNQEEGKSQQTSGQGGSQSTSRLEDTMEETE